MFKGFLKAVLTGGLLCAAVAFGAAASEAYSIFTFEDLCKIGKDPHYPLSGIYHLENDIDASASRAMNDGKGFEPIGSMPDYLDPDLAEGFIEGFSGAFYGHGYAIIGLYIYRPDENGVGLFKRLGANYPLTFTRDEYQHYYVPEIRGLTVKVNVTGRSRVGGLTGENDGGVIADCSVEGSVIAAEGTVGGLAGGNHIINVNVIGMSADFWTGGSITNSSSAASVISLGAPTNDACGASYGDGLGKRNCWGGSPHADAGGLVGYNTGSISGSRATGDVNGLKDAVGGLVGFTISAWASSIANSYATGKVSTLGGSAGGLVGMSYEGRIFRSYAMGPVHAGGDAGGLVGYSLRAEITDCYARGDVTADMNVGGLVGYFSNLPGPGPGLGKRNSDKTSPAPPAPPYITIRNSYATGSVITSAYDVIPEWWLWNTGGLVGRYTFSTPSFFAPGVVNSYWDITASGMSVSENSNGVGAGKTTAEMMARQTFEDWNFTDVWRINEGETYPYFIWQDGPVVSITHNTRVVRSRTNSFMPQISVKGRTLNVKLSPSQQLSSQNLQIRVIDMRGRTIYSRAVNNSANASLSLTKIPAGRYIVEVKKSGARVGSVPVVVR